MRAVFAIVATVLCFGATAAAEPAPTELMGYVVNAFSETAVEDAIVRIGDVDTLTDDEGFYVIAVPSEGRFLLEMFIPVSDGSYEPLRQWLDRADVDLTNPRRTFVLDDGGAPTVPGAVGVPGERPSTTTTGGAIDLLERWARDRDPDAPSGDDIFRLELPELIPNTIRVGRRDAGSCSGNPILRIEEVDLETYAAGVVTAEIGVFRSLTTGADGQLEGFKTFAIAARAYALWFWARDPEADYHLDDTACNQRYVSGPYHELIVQAAADTAGTFLVKEDSEFTIDKYEYAAACGRHGTLPEYQDETIPDITGGEACTTGGWCGHSQCAAHQVNPDFPDEGRCLVRGICQWGTAERSARGDSYLEILSHYQPNLQTRSVNPVVSTRLLGVVRAESIETGLGVPGASVSLEGGVETTTNSSGFFVFDALNEGQYDLTVSATGFTTVETSVEIREGRDNWTSVVLSSPDSPSVDSAPDLNTEADVTEDTPDSVTQDNRRTPDAIRTPTTEESGLSRFAVVGEDGLGEEGCVQVGARGGRSWFPSFVLVFASFWVRKKRRG